MSFQCLLLLRKRELVFCNQFRCNKLCKVARRTNRDAPFFLYMQRGFYRLFWKGELAVETISNFPFPKRVWQVLKSFHNPSFKTKLRPQKNSYKNDTRAGQARACMYNKPKGSDSVQYDDIDTQLFSDPPKELIFGKNGNNGSLCHISEAVLN